jgi:SAM-dependent methyltransferase
MVATHSGQDDWDNHWVRYAETARRNPAQIFRIRLIREALKRHESSPMRILDIGSGVGGMAKDLSQAFPSAKIAGVDLSDSAVKFASEHVPTARFFQQNLLEPVKIPEEFVGWATHAVCSEVLEHVERPELLLANARTLLAPDALVVITVPGGPRSAFDIHIGHRKHYTPDDLDALLRASGLRPVSIDAAGFPFFNLYKMTVIARGKKLVQDVDTSSGRETLATRAADLSMRAFNQLFRYNKTTGKHGWQLVAVARNESAS